jgi:PBSX family phage terminase large subunit
MRLTKKQAEYIRDANRRWCFKGGATGSGKSFLDALYVIPNRILERRDKDGLIFIMGTTKETIERNVLHPMREIYGNAIGEINSRNCAKLFNQKVYCLGSEKINQVSKFRGPNAKYIYGDEVVDWHEDVFNFIKSRLRLECSCFDGTYNPGSPSHFLYKFIYESQGLDIYNQHYTIDDNPYYDQKAKEELKKEYAGTVYYDRYIDGLWKRAEGAIYRVFSENKGEYIKQFDKSNIHNGFISIGIDFGGERSATAFCATWISSNYDAVHFLEAERHKGDVDPTELYRLFMAFAQKIKAQYGNIYACYADSMESILIRGLRTANHQHGLDINVLKSLKLPIVERIRFTVMMMGRRKMLVQPSCVPLIQAFDEAVWNRKADGDERLDDRTTPIDDLDAAEYSIEPFIKFMV